MLDDNYLFTVTDLKQFDYCGRVVFYERCLPHVRPRTFKMDAGRDAHANEQQRAARRTLRQYDLQAGQRAFDVSLTSSALGLTGIVDEVVYPEAGGCFPVDYKLTRKVSANHKLQLAAYARLLEEQMETRIERGYIYLIKSRQMVEVPMTTRLHNRLTTLLREMKQAIVNELLPAATKVRRRCAACEFRRFCNDV